MDESLIGVTDFNSVVDTLCLGQNHTTNHAEMVQIVQRRVDEINRIIESAQSRDNSLLGGNAGLALYYFNQYETTELSSWKEKAGELVEQIINEVEGENPRLSGSSFCGGVAGLAWLISFFKQRQFINWDLKGELSDLDDYLFESGMEQIKGDYLDYLHGSMGILHYFTTRMHEPAIRSYADEMIDALHARAIHGEKGICFRNYMSPLSRDPQINLSLSHGLSGILLILMNAWKHSERKELINEMLDKSIRYILSFRKDVDFSSGQFNFFPFTINDENSEASETNRLAWCYGDLNQVILLNRAGTLLGQHNYTRLSELIGLQTLLRKDASATLATDSHFCHGSAGLAQIYKTLYEETGQQAYLSGYNYWIEQTVLNLERELQTGKYLGKERDFLEGLVGVGLALLNYTTDKKLYWANALLL